LEIIKGDLSIPPDLDKLPADFDVIFHLAADPEVRLSVTNPESIFYNNIQATYNLLEWAKKTTYHTLIFTSTSAVYGEATKFPTPESDACAPISLYGGSKLACESLISAYSYTYKKKGIVVRLANVVGPTTNHGILYDMLKKLRQNKAELEILGDGNQNKSYLYIDDCISGLIKLTEESDFNYQVYNLGSTSQITVKEIIDIILNEAGIMHINKIFTGGIDGGRGWVGDVRNMLLDTQKIRKLGWQPKLDSAQAIRKACQEMVKMKPLR